MIKVNEISKYFGDKKALNKISFHINEGEVLGIVGHNGAGKSTLINSLIKLHKIDSGEITYGFDEANFYENIGVQMQQSHFEDKAKVIDMCNLYKNLTSSNLDIDSLLKDFHLYNEKNNFIKNLSGGNRQRLSILLTILNRPKVIFLDELTTGLDPVARRNVWEILNKINKEHNTTIVLTSHFLDEIEHLCHKVIILNEGNLIYCGTVSNLMDNNTNCKKLIQFRLKNTHNEHLLKKYDFKLTEDFKYEIHTKDHEEILKYLLQQVGVDNLTVKSPTFEDVFLNMTGYKLDKEGAVINE